MKKRKLIIDTNLFLVLVIGGVEGGRHIKNSNRLNKFTVEDYHLIVRIMSAYDEVFITHYIATEVSNLIDLKGDAAHKAYGIARALFSEFTQIDSSIRNVSESDLFHIYGVTDCSLIMLVDSYHILTDDSRLLTPLFALHSENVLPYDLAKQIYNK